MNNMNVTAEAVQTTNVSQPKHKWLAKGSRFAKKAVLTATVMSSMAAMCTTQAFAATGVVDHLQLYYHSLHGTQVHYLPDRRRCRRVGRCQPP